MPEENRVTLLTRDPHWLFAYWDISDDSLEAFRRELGDDLWEKSVPVLKVTNVTKNESIYIRINEFSNSWYINVPDSDSLYIAEVGRKVSERLFIGYALSNQAVTPVDTLDSSSSASFANYMEVKNGRYLARTVNINEKALQEMGINEYTGLSSFILNHRKG